MANCKLCKRSGIFIKVNSEGLCGTCYPTFLLSVKSLLQVINESVKIIDESKNLKTRIKRCEIIIQRAGAFVKYENAGIKTTKPTPSEYVKFYTTKKTELISISEISLLPENISLISPNPLAKSDNSEIILSNQKIILPLRTKKMVYLSDKTPRNISNGLNASISVTFSGDKVKIENISSDDPSTIFINMPIRKPSEPDKVLNPNYWPSYVGLNPEQKWIYLNWLRDVKQKIQIGYVFIYYYGLERQLLMGDFDLAFDEILLLRQHHNNGSFINYSTSALIYSSLLKKRPERIKQLYQIYPPEKYQNFDLLIAHNLKIDLPANALIKAAKNIPDTNRRYIDNNIDLYELSLNECLIKKFGEPNYPISRQINISEVPKDKELIFANSSLSDQDRYLELPDFYEYKPFIDEMKELFKDAHNETKTYLKEHRKQIN